MIITDNLYGVDIMEEAVEAFRSAIRGGLRQGTLERNGNLIRAT